MDMNRTDGSDWLSYFTIRIELRMISTKRKPVLNCKVMLLGIVTKV